MILIIMTETEQLINSNTLLQPFQSGKTIIQQSGAFKY